MTSKGTFPMVFWFRLAEAVVKGVMTDVIPTDNPTSAGLARRARFSQHMCSEARSLLRPWVCVVHSRLLRSSASLPGSQVIVICLALGLGPLGLVFWVPVVAAGHRAPGTPLFFAIAVSRSEGGAVPAAHLT